MDARMTAGQQARFIDGLSQWIAEESRVWLEMEADRHAKETESPIELAFWLACLAYRSRICPGGPVPKPNPQFEVEANGRSYRLDFAFVGKCAGKLVNGECRVAIELDGHEFHERTPEQVDRRNQRDADLQTVGWRVLHFSGREILRDPGECMDRVFLAVLESAAPRGISPGSTEA